MNVNALWLFYIERCPRSLSRARACMCVRVDLQLRVSRLGAVSNWKFISWPSCCRASHREEREKSVIWRKEGAERGKGNDDDKMATNRVGSAQNFINICKTSIKRNQGVFCSHDGCHKTVPAFARASFLLRGLCLSVFHNFERDICCGFSKPLLLIPLSQMHFSAVSHLISLWFISYKTLHMNISVAPCHVTLWVCHVICKSK